jgi:hypothetical protein
MARDFDGDGMADLLWRDTSGNTAMWFCDPVFDRGRRQYTDNMVQSVDAE